ncbi:MAG: amidohydrolase family protein, partial [Raoultibacter sp.]
MDVAHDARRRGMHTLAGAPNVVMGKSHSGNLSAREAVKEGAIDMLCSDYYPAALLQAVFLLHHVCGVELNDAVAFATANPAKAAGLFNEVGSIAVGKRADILVVRELPVLGTTDVPTNPVVTQAYVAGRLVYGSRYPQFADESNDSQAAIDRLAHEHHVLSDERVQADTERVQVVR